MIDSTSTGINDSNTIQPALTFYHIASVYTVIFLWLHLVFQGGMGAGLFLAVLCTEVLFFPWQLKTRQTNAAEQKYQILNPAVSALTLIIIILSLYFLIFENQLLRAVNFLVLLILLPAQFMLVNPIKIAEWYLPAFWLELFLSGIVRPFICLDGLPRFIRHMHKAKNESAKNRTIKKTLIQIGLGLILVLPFLFLLSSLLASADAVFASYINTLTSWFNSLSIGRLPGQLLISLVILPFGLSWMISGLSGRSIIPHIHSNNRIDQDTAAKHNTDKQADIFGKTFFITVLASINTLYLVFALIQFTYLISAWQAQLPDGMTYAEYARSGFFELLAVSLINLLILLLVIRRFDRKGKSGVVLRIMILLLLAGSFVQWFSAIFRMRLYVQTYSLTQLRFYSTALMMLIFTWLLMLLAAEWIQRIKLSKWFISSALIALLLINAVNPDARIAQYNVQKYLTQGSGQPKALDFHYLSELSDDALPQIIPLLDANESSIRQQAKELFDVRREKIQYRQDHSAWQSWTISQYRAAKLLE